MHGPGSLGKGKMSMDAKDFKKVLKEGEGVYVEFKRGRTGAEDDTYETICSFLNRFGGDIFLGVEDDRTVTGVPHNSIPNFTKNIISMLGDPNIISPTIQISPGSFEYEGKDIIHIHVPMSSEPHTFKKLYYDRIGDSDIKMRSTSMITSMFLRKLNIHTEEKVYPYIEDDDLRFDLFPKIRIMAETRQENHPWKNMTDKEIIQSSKLYAQDPETGKWGYNLAAVLLLGKDEAIKRVCSVHRTDALLRKVNVDRYDDRLIVETNLIESYGLLMGFAQKHLLDKFHLEDSKTFSLSGAITREMIVNSLMHREYTDGFHARFVIEKDRMYVENANRAAGAGPITPKNIKPNSKNPIIAAFFRNIGYADEMGSGTRNLYNYVKKYSNKYPELIEDDIFKIIVPLDDSYSFDANIGHPKAMDMSDLTDTESKVYALICTGNMSTAAMIAEAALLSVRTVERTLAILSEHGYIRRVGGKRYGKWTTASKS